MATPNIVNVTTINGTSVQQPNVSTSAQTLVTCASNHVYKINTIYVANRTAGNISITCQVIRSSSTTYLAYQMVVPGNSSLVIIGKDSPIYLNEADYVQVLASAANSLDVILSYDDIS
jgi:hypothetical protein